MKLSFVIPAYNEEAYLGECLESIIKQIEGRVNEIEIIVVNNASTDRTKEIASSYPQVQVVDEPRKGLVWARHAGLVAASGELIANVDADNRLTKGWLEKVLKEFSHDQKLVALSGPFIYYDLSPMTAFWVRIFYYLAYFNYLINHYILKVAGMLQGGNYVVKRTALEKAGGYNFNFEFYGEDTEMARRLGKIGKVKFTFGLPIYSSGRRLQGEGVARTAMIYIANYFSTIFFNKPISKGYTAFRLKAGHHKK